MQPQVTAAIGRTDFSQYSHAQLVQMLFAGSPQSVKEAAETWASAGKYLHEQASDVEQQLGEFSDKWAGTAAEQYKTMITDLNAGIRTVADTVLKVRDLTFSAAESLEEAQRTMPMPVDVPALAPSTVAMATTPLPVSQGYSTAAMADMQRQQTEAVQAVQEHRQAQAAADAAHQQAIAVMTKLAGHYTATYQAMPVTPTATAAPTLDNPAPVTPPPLVPGGSQGAALTPLPPVDGNAPAATPLFTKMFGAGMAAASAALGGRFANALPRLLGRGKEGKDKQPQTPTTPTTTPTGGAAGGAGGGAGGGAPKFGGEAAGNPAMAGGAGGSGMTSGTSGLTTAAAGAAGAAATAGRPMGMVPPMMPFAPMGADGGGRRIPPWLVETEDVWGEPSVVAPPVIGEDRDAGAVDSGQPRSPWS